MNNDQTTDLEKRDAIERYWTDGPGFLDVPSTDSFTGLRQIRGGGDLWISELVITYDAVPSYTMSVMQFVDGKVASKTQYFCDPFEPGASRAHLVESMR